jgi:GNAT superfamily N-acetyltransferase
MKVVTPSAPVPIAAEHDLVGFDCGEPSLNEWLRKRALANERIGASRTYVICLGTSVIGYYCLSAGAIGRAEAPGALRRNMPDPVPVMVLGRLAIDLNHHNQGLGSALLRDGVLRALGAAQFIGAAAILVHAISESGRRFYLSRGFIESPIHPRTLCLVLSTARKSLAE